MLTFNIFHMIYVSYCILKCCVTAVISGQISTGQSNQTSVHQPWRVKEKTLLSNCNWAINSELSLLLSSQRVWEKHSSMKPQQEKVPHAEKETNFGLPVLYLSFQKNSQ